jgi:hypothetical protein
MTGLVKFIQLRYYSLAIIFMLCITLVPPLNWNLPPSLHKNEKEYYSRKYGSKLPYKNHDFIFSSTTEEFYLGDNFYNPYRKKYYKEYVPLEREIILWELLLYYLIIILFFVSFFKRKEVK